MATDQAPPRRPPQLICCCGLPGSGKSWLAGRLARHNGFQIVSNDVIAWRDGPADMDHIYQRARERALEGLSRSADVILDGSYFRKSYRQAALEIARRCPGPVETWLLVFQTPPAIAMERFARRVAQAPIAAPHALFRQIADRFEWPDREERDAWGHWAVLDGRDDPMRLLEGHPLQGAQDRLAAWGATASPSPDPDNADR